MSSASADRPRKEQRLDGDPVAVVMDMGGTWIRVALATRDGELIWKDRTPTNAGGGADAIIRSAEQLLRQAVQEAGSRSISGIGAGMAGPVDPHTGIMHSPPNLRALDGISPKSVLADRLKRSILVGNDATLAALGEYTYGQGAGARTLVYMTISTGIGGGMVIDGSPLMGAHGMAGELGHMVVDPNGPSCSCGGSGCLEALASGTAIAERARGLIQNGGTSSISRMASGDTEGITAAMVFAAAEAGDSLARCVLDDAARALGVGLVNILHIFDPDVIVLGGGVSGNWEYLRPAVQSYIESHAMPHVFRAGYRLLVSGLGDDIGLLGAAALVWRCQP